MRGMFSVQFNGVAVTAVQDFFELVAGSDVACAIHEVSITQSSDMGDAQDEGLSILLKRGVGATTGSGGSAVTPAAVGAKATAATVAAARNNTTKMSGGTITTLRADVMNVRAGYSFLPTPECRPVLAAGERFTVELGTAPADSLTVNCTVVFEELS